MYPNECEINSTKKEPGMHSIQQYVWRKNRRVGLLMAVKVGERVFIAGSKVNLKKGDKFDVQRANEIALDRISATHADNRTTRVASSLRDDLLKFKNRCMRYFKTENISMPECGPKSIEFDNAAELVAEIIHGLG